MTLDLKTLGAIGDGSATGDSLIVKNALIQSGATGEPLHIPNGKFLCSERYLPNLTAEAITVFGDGPQSQLWFPNGDGILVTAPHIFKSFHFRDFSMTTGLAGGPHEALQVACTAYSNTGKSTPASDIKNVEIRGYDSYGDGALYWPVGIYINNMATTNFDGVGVYGAVGNHGAGIMVQGSANISGIPSYATVFNIADSIAYGLDTGFIYGTYVQGVVLSNFNCTKGRVGVKVADGAVGLDQLDIVNGSQFGGMSYAAVQMSSKCNCFNMSDTLMIVPANAYGALINSDSFTVNGNRVAGTGASGNEGFDVLDSIQGIIGNNMIADVAIGINLRAAAHDITVPLNSYRNVTNHVINAGSGNTVVAQ